MAERGGNKRPMGGGKCALKVMGLKGENKTDPNFEKKKPFKEKPI